MKTQSMKTTLSAICSVLLFGGNLASSHAAVVVSDSLAGTPGAQLQGEVTPIGNATWQAQWNWDSAYTVFNAAGTGITRGGNETVSGPAAGLLLPTTYTNSVLTVKADIRINDGGSEFTFGAIGFSETLNGPIGTTNSLLNASVYRPEGGFNGWQITSNGTVIASGGVAAIAGSATWALTYDQINDVASFSINGTVVASGVAVSPGFGPVASSGFQLLSGLEETGLVQNFEVSVVPEPQVTAMLLMGGVGMMVMLQRRKRRLC